MTRLLVANRGEIACRIIRAAHAVGIEAVAVHSEQDAQLPHVSMADQAVCIGPAAARQSYLDAEKLIRIAGETGCTLVHPGYGFLSENADFARRCVAAGLTFVGPSADHIALMGDKQNARDAAIASGVPVLPGTGRLGTDEATLREQAAAIGYPLLVKATAGGGGHGMQRIDDPAALIGTIERTRDFAGRIFGDDSLYLERCLGTARHVEVQVFGFGRHGAVHLFERDCSLQRRHQKVVEEAPAPGLSPATRDAMTEAACNLARSIGYSGAGTVEYLYEPATGEFFFLEMNTRIQVEHPVTEVVTGQDLVAAQIRFAMAPDARPLPAQDALRLDGVAIEARVYAENPSKRFLPAPGRIDSLILPRLADVDFHCGYATGNEVSVHYDPLVMKVVARGSDRAAARQTLVDALKRVEIQGLTTNLPFLIELLEHPDVVQAEYDTTFIEAGMTC
ncbi:acetyl-CoA carboxylase biotin carboxylase subunit [Pseudooceanicola aestuarii]|uniref:acetyl-CoA carboxylase biotin carboxylase subunit n=1 Tax=Pseudooceanicola aestuarii TaxID=2697319 RepID=UPI0013D803B8|nr:biotin carboxylase N-terminal domain-containing protein [Pseudooceanicola aestuarii]